MNAIEIRDLTKSFRGMHALNGLNMTVPKGAIYGLDADSPEQVVSYLHENGITVSEILTERIGLEEYYIKLMEGSHQQPKSNTF